jgi:hypothetical protein
MHVLQARWLVSESQLAFAGLHPLLRPALHLLEALPAPSRVRLRARSDSPGGPGSDR